MWRNVNLDYLPALSMYGYDAKSWSMIQLHDRLKEHGQPIHGKKQVLIERAIRAESQLKVWHLWKKQRDIYYLGLENKQKAVQLSLLGNSSSLFTKAQKNKK